jgi:hypothetical protein
MKNLFLYLFLIAITTSCTTKGPNDSEVTPEQTDDREIYQLKVYTFENEAQVKTTDQYLKDFYLPALKEKGVENVGVFKSIPNENDSTKKTYVLIPFQSLNQWFDVDQAVNSGTQATLASIDYHNATHEQLAYQRIESVIMRAFPDMPEMTTPSMDAPRSTRIYELRSYESPTEAYYKRKVDMFNAGGEIKLFDRLGFNAVFYADVLSGAQMPNLIYMTTFPDRPTRDSLWKEFVDAPEWKAIVDLPKYTNTVSHADVLLLRPTEYSDY